MLPAFDGKERDNTVGSWLRNRWRCYWHGHRDLSLSASFGGVLADGRIRELHLCRACDSLVWTEHRPSTAETNPTWTDLGI
jgi:hypothetical protein